MNEESWKYVDVIVNGSKSDLISNNLMIYVSGYTFEVEDKMKTVKVVAAVMIEDGRIFSTQRGYGDFKGGWEFPGGKVEIGETSQEALVREIKEELDIEITVGELLDTVEYDYPQFHLSMECFLCKMKSGKLVLKEHNAVKWLTKDTLDSVEWLPADLGLINKLKNFRII